MKVLENAMATVQSDTCLGPSLTTEVKLEGVSVKALVDTGSPSTIVSLKFLVDALAKQKKSDESPAQWRKRVEQRLEPPGPRLKSYGGEKLNTVCQIKVSLSRGEHSAECVAQVQSGAPVDLLLGTDVHSRLGILVLVCDSSENTTDLFSNQCWSEKTDSTLVEPTLGNIEPQEGTVKLITATRLPARQARLVRARVEGADDVSVTLLQPASWLRERGLIIEEAALAPDDEHCVSIPIQNFSHEPLSLEPGELLGQIEPVTLLTDPTPLVEDSIEFEKIVSNQNSDVAEKDIVIPKKDNGNSGLGSGCGNGDVVVDTINESSSKDTNDDDSREARLLKGVHIDNNLSPQEVKQLNDLILEFSDIFALDQAELSSTDVAIDAGDSTPIKQHPRRIPFALRSIVDHLVSEMLDQGIVVPSKSPCGAGCQERRQYTLLR